MKFEPHPPFRHKHAYADMAEFVLNYYPRPEDGKGGLGVRWFGDRWEVIDEEAVEDRWIEVGPDHMRCDIYIMLRNRRFYDDNGVIHELPQSKRMVAEVYAAAKALAYFRE